MAALMSAVCSVEGGAGIFQLSRKRKSPSGGCDAGSLIVCTEADKRGVGAGVGTCVICAAMQSNQLSRTPCIYGQGGVPTCSP
jgi:hypothetical protein